MRVLVCTRSDEASVNIRDHLVALGGWEDTGRTFRDGPVLARSEALLIEIEGPHIRDERLDHDLHHLGLPLRDIWFLSKHRAASGKPSLTVHPIGNHKDAAAAGGKPNTLSPAAPRDMGALLRRMAFRRDEANLPHEVTYEATHHGPTMTIPSLFVEIGSNEDWYEDPASGHAMALAVDDVLDGLGRSTGPVLVGIGFGHYVPRMTSKGLAGDADFGHLLPHHFVDEENGLERLRRCIEATPECAGVYVPKKDLKGPQRQAVRAWLEELDIPAWPPVVP